MSFADGDAIRTIFFKSLPMFLLTFIPEQEEDRQFDAK
jgi:hypothetical protein